MEEIKETAERARGSPAAAARGLAMTALSRVGELLEREDTDPRLLVSAAKLVLWAAGQEDDGTEGALELRFTGGADNDL